jgi:PAS domain S-box-containing protein
MNAPPPASKMMSGRLREAILAPYRIEQLRDDPRLTALTDFAAALCQAPAAFVSLVTDEFQYFVARTGTQDRQSSLERGFCVHAMGRTNLLVVNDATLDPYFRENPLVTGTAQVRFYAGAPLINQEGASLGALCIIDQKPRDGLTDLQAKGLSTLAQAVMTLFEAHRLLIAEQAETNLAKTQRDERGQRFDVLADSMPQMVWSTLPNGFNDYCNARWYEFTGVPQGSTQGEAWVGMFHPDDQQRSWDRWHACLATGEPFEIEYRLREANGNYRWVLGRALPMRDTQGKITRWFGTCTDIHDQKVASEQRELISHELSHRIKNIFAVIGGLITVSSRQHPEIKSVADDLRDRVMALSKAHDFVRPHSEVLGSPHRPTSLHGMVKELLAPYQSASNERIQISGDDPGIDDQSATPLALLFHELGTNAAKYGSLSSELGFVTLAIQVDADSTVMQWHESCGPRITRHSADGFGSSLIAMSVEKQLGGTIERDWLESGLKVTVKIPTKSVCRS